MTSRQAELAPLGWSDWFEERAGCGPAETVARVAAVDRDSLLLIERAGTFRAKLPGGYLHRNRLAQERPCVGDWVRVERPRAGDPGIVRALIERRTLLRRKSAGESAEHQLIAANVDYVVVVQACDYDFNVKRLERYLVMIRDGGAEPYILLTKTDLVAPQALAARLSELRAAGIAAPTLTLSNVTREGVAELERALLPGKTYCFVGSSGVGKSTLVNRLVGRDRMQTQGVSGTGEGRHTTVRRELIVLESGALVIDTPGMREFGIVGTESGLEGGFPDILELAGRCRYGDCGHAREPGCAVVEAIEAGALSREHYDNYLKLRKESEFQRMSYADRRKKDRKLGRHIKSVLKDLEEDR